MRKITFIKSDNPIRKLMIYASSSNVHLFLYDAVDDRPCIADRTFKTPEDAETHCQEMYHADKNDWIHISDPLVDCQDDFISPTRVKGRKTGNPKWGQFQYLNGKWTDIAAPDKYLSFTGMRESESLFIAGLLDEYDHAQMHDPQKAIKIRSNLGLPFDPVLCVHFA